MDPIARAKRSRMNLGISFAIAVAVLVISVLVNVSPVSASFPVQVSLRAAGTITNVLFCWLAILLWLAFARWRQDERRCMGLEDVISGISPDTLLVVNRHRKILMCNASVERMFGYSEQEVLNCQTDMLYMDRRVHKEETPREVYEALEREGYHVGLATGMRKDGSTVPLEVITGELPDGTTGAVLLLRDISDRIRAEEERRRFEERVRTHQKLESLGVLAGGVAHDFNNLLTGIMGHAELACETVPADHAAFASMDAIIKSSRRAAELCRDMLTFAGKRRVEVEPLDLSQSVRGMMSILALSVPKPAELQYDLGTSLPLIEADPSQIQQVIMNLVTNAGEALGDDGGTIAVTTGEIDQEHAQISEGFFDEADPPKRMVFLDVTDNGCGMSRETIGKIFEPFYSTKFPGRGLGLSAVQGILRSRHGAFRISSDEGQGTTFRVFFPAK